MNGIDEEELVEVWMAFSVSQLRGADPTLDTLVQMERKEFGKKQDHQPQPQQQSSRSQENTLVIYVGKESGYPLYSVEKNVAEFGACSVLANICICSADFDILRPFFY